jgi:hypothetical protein
MPTRWASQFCPGRETVILPRCGFCTYATLSDGALDNWDYLSNLELGLSPSALADLEQIEIVDFCHAADHLKRGCEAIYPRNPDKSKAKMDSAQTVEIPAKKQIRWHSAVADQVLQESAGRFYPSKTQPNLSPTEAQLRHAHIA